MNKGNKKIISKIREEISELPNDMPSLTMAKLLYHKYKHHFSSVEVVRNIVRYTRGEKVTGQKREFYDKPVNIRTSQQKSKSNQGLSFLNKSEYQSPITWRLPKAIKKVLLLSDIHVPFHDLEAIIAAVKHGQKEKVDAVFLNGDIIDMYSMSDHEKDPTKFRLNEELELGREFLKAMREEFPNIPIYYIPGNHEYRMERWLMKKAPELLGMSEFRLDILLRLGEIGIEWLPYGSKIYFGKLMVEHGCKIKGAGGINPARTLLLQFKRPVICGHFHRTSAANAVVYDGEQQMAWSMGCLCIKEMAYLLRNDWNSGFAIVEVEHNGNFKVRNHQIINGEVY